MKKLTMMAMMLVASATAFAGDSDALKAILKAKTYAEAESLVKSNLGSLADASEKAKAYNKLVDLSIEKVNKETTIIAQNQVAEQMKTGKTEAYDTLGLGDALVNAINDAIECNKYDQQPNAKGKVAPKFAEKNAQRIWGVRTNLVNLGQDAAQNNDDAHALKYWGAFLDSRMDPLFDKQDKTPEADYIGQVAYFTGSYAQQANDFARAKRYYDIAAKDEKLDQRYKDAANASSLNMMKEGLKDKADTLRVIDEMKAMYAQDPDNDILMDAIYNLYGGIKDKESQKALLDSRLARDPNNFIALADKGFLAMEDNDANEAVEYLGRAIEAKPDNVVIRHYYGLCLNAKAAQTAETDPAKAKEIYKMAVDSYDKCKEQDPDMLQVKWGYNRYQAYYGYYGPDAPETQQAEAESH